MLKNLLLRSRKKRGLKRKISYSKMKNRVSIHERPEEINTRLEYGHFEGDLFYNSGSQSKNALTLIERYTRFTIIIINENKRTETVIDALINYILTYKLFIRSLTFDNGSEFTDFHKLIAMGIKVYFCDPGSPWQKGSIENVNGVIRRYMPFKMPSSSINQEIASDTADKINNLPRAILGFKTA